jgi:hypothetical protein
MQMSDPLEAVKKMFGGMGFALPGMITPTLNLSDLDKNISDLKSVEGWLKANLSLLQMNIQTLELQRASVAAFQAVGETLGKAAKAAAPASQPATPSADSTPGVPMGTAELAKVANVAEAALGAMLNPANWTLGAKPAEAPAEPAKKPQIGRAHV